MMTEQATDFHFDRNCLNQMADSSSAIYQNAEPFPHIVLDDFLPRAVADRVLEEFPGVEDIEWSRYVHEDSKKLASDRAEHMGPLTRHLISQFNNSDFINFLEKLTGIEGLVPDPHLWGGGLHQTPRGGYLNVHADFNFYKRLKLDRRLNLLLYLNKDWQEEYGGPLTP